MDYLGFFLALLGFLIAVAVWFRSVKKEQQALADKTEMQQQLASTNAAKSAAEHAAAEERQRSNRLGETVTMLEKNLAAAIARRDQKQIARAMWTLELERTYRQWRDVIAPSSSARTVNVNEGQQLSYAIACEVDRLREEVGVAIRIDGAFDCAIDAEYALGMLRIAEELLALGAKSADEVHVAIAEVDGPKLQLDVTCDGWEYSFGVDESAAVLDIVRQMAARLDGSVVTTHDDDGAFAIVVQIPALLPTSDEIIDVTDAIDEPIEKDERQRAAPFDA